LPKSTYFSTAPYAINFEVSDDFEYITHEQAKICEASPKIEAIKGNPGWGKVKYIPRYGN
jgi:hypothetical protein